MGTPHIEMIQSQQHIILPLGWQQSVLVVEENNWNSIEGIHNIRNIRHIKLFNESMKVRKRYKSKAKPKLTWAAKRSMRIFWARKPFVHLAKFLLRFFPPHMVLVSPDNYSRCCNRRDNNETLMVMKIVKKKRKNPFKIIKKSIMRFLLAFHWLISLKKTQRHKCQS